MTNVPVFGDRIEGASCTPRPAAYAVIEDQYGRFAFVRAGEHLFLVGGGTEPGESPEVTIVREAREECARPVELGHLIGCAVQYFEADGIHFEMTATFFAAEFVAEADGPGEHELVWITPDDAETRVFHECHRWAIREYISRQEATANSEA